VGIGTTTPDASSVLELSSNNRGVLVPRLTTSQRTGISSPANGLLVYDTNLNCFYYYNASGWTSLCSVAGPTGPTGPVGPTGLTGPTGPTGSGATNKWDLNG